MKKKSEMELGYFIDVSRKEVLISLDDLIRYTKNFTKTAVEDFEYKRAIHINELLDYGEDIDIRSENEWTRFASKNMKTLGNGLAKRLDMMNKDLLGMAKEQKKNGRKKRV